MLTDVECILLLEGCGWLEYLGNLYEYIQDIDKLHYFHNINDLTDYITVSDRALRKSTEFYYTEKY